MSACVVMISDPFKTEQGRSVVPVTHALSVRDWLNEQGIVEFQNPTLCQYNGLSVLRADWSNTIIRDGDIVTFLPLPLGGGGGGKNPLRTVLMIAVMVVATVYGGPLGAAVGIPAGAGAGMGIAAGAVQAAVGGAIIAFAGTTLINAVIPAPRPSGMDFGSAGSAIAPSPTYSLSAQGNQARLGQPIPVLYGRHMIYPNLASIPYQEFVDNEQYIFQLHVIGQGEYDMEQVRIEDTPITSFEEVETEIIAPGGSVTLFESNVVTAPEVAGQELLSAADGGDWVGPFTANPAGTLAGHLGVDVVFPRGLYYVNNEGGKVTRTVDWEVQARAIDDQGVATGSWTSLGSESYSAATNTPQRQSYKYAVTPGRYEVRLQRLDARDTSSRAAHEIRWGSLRSYLDGMPDFGNVTLLAVRMRATDNLTQQSSRMINCRLASQ